MGFFSFISNPLLMSFDLEGTVRLERLSHVFNQQSPRDGSNRNKLMNMNLQSGMTSNWIILAWNVQNILHNHLELIKAKNCNRTDDGRQREEVEIKLFRAQRRFSIMKLEWEIKSTEKGEHERASKSVDADWKTRKLQISMRFYLLIPLNSIYKAILPSSPRRVFLQVARICISSPSADWNALLQQNKLPAWCETR